MTLGERIQDLVIQQLEGTDKFLVEVVVQQGNKFLVYIDGDNGLTIRNCQELSRTIEKKFDRDVEDYDLTVSSAGADQPLKLERQYRKNVGRSLEVTTVDGTKIEGKLIQVGSDEIVLEPVVIKKKKEIQETAIKIAYSSIKTGKIKLTFGK